MSRYPEEEYFMVVFLNRWCKERVKNSGQARKIESASSRASKKA